MLERAKEVTRNGPYTYVEYVRWADDLVILVDSYRRHDWLLRVVHRRLREELAKLGLQVNEDKSSDRGPESGESFGFLGFDFRRVRSRRGVWRPQYTPKLKAADDTAEEAQGDLPSLHLSARGSGDRR